ncbi:MAG: hypothetical protein ACLQVD_09970 [Capsulimonadaceae bacterium]
MSLDPENGLKSNELTERADLLLLGGDSDQARTLLEQALVFNPSNSEALRILVGLHARQPASPAIKANDFPGYSSASRFEPADTPIANPRTNGSGPALSTANPAEVHILLAQAQQQLARDPMAARSLLQRVISLDPDNEVAVELIGRLVQDGAVDEVEDTGRCKAHRRPVTQSYLFWVVLAAVMLEIRLHIPIDNGVSLAQKAHITPLNEGVLIVLLSGVLGMLAYFKNDWLTRRRDP